jgi:hypothetical protein
MKRSLTRFVALLTLGVIVTLTGCELVQGKKIPPGQQKKEQHDNRDKKK